MFKKILGLVFLSFIISSPAFSGPPPFCYQEEDGSPSGCFKKIKFANGTITDNGDGTFSHSQAGAGGGDITDVGPDCSSGGCFVDGANDRLVFEGSTADTVESTLGATDPTVGDQTFNLPDMAAGGTYTLATTPIFFDDAETTGNVTYVGCSDSIADAITAATAGDTLVLGACTYTVSSALAVNKSISIVGQGIGVTILDNTGSDINTISVTADGFYLSDIEFTGSDVTDTINIDCTAGTTCTDIVIRRFKITMSALDGSSSDGVEAFDSSLHLEDGYIYMTTSMTGTAQTRGIFKHAAASQEAATTHFFKNIYIDVNCTADSSNALCRGLMVWNNGADESSFGQVGVITDTNVVLRPQNASTQTEAFQHQGALVYSDIFGGSFNGATGGATTLNADLRCDDGATCNFNGSIWVTGRTDTSGGTITKNGQIQAGGVSGDALPKMSSSSGAALSGRQALNLTSGEGGDNTGTGSQTGGAGGSIVLTSGLGGVADSANTASTGGVGGAFTYTGGTGGAASVATGTNVGGKGGSFTFTGGTGGATASGTTNTGGAGGDISLFGGAGGAGSTAAGSPGVIKFGISAENEQWDYSNSNIALNTSATGITQHNYRNNGTSRIYLSADYDNNSGTEAPELRLLNDAESVSGFFLLEGSTAATKSTGTLANATLLGTEDNLSLQFVTNDSVRMTVLNSGLVGVGTNAPSNTLSFSGEANRKIWMEDELTAETAGRDLTIQAGGAGAGTDDSGGNLNLASGSAVGNNGSVVNIQTVATGQGTGTTDRDPATSSTFGGSAASAYLDLGTALGVRLSTDGDGALTFLGLGAGSDEDLTWNFDDTANQVDVSTSTGVTSVEFNSIDLIVPTEAYDEAGWNADTSVPTKDAVRDKIESLSLGAGAPTDADYLVGTTNGSLSAEIVVGTSPGGELGGTWASPTLDDSVTTTGWVMGTFSGTTLTAGTVNIDLLDGVGAVDMDYGSADITDHTFTTDGTGDGEIVLPNDSIGVNEIGDDAILEVMLKAVDAAGDEECLTYETTTGDFEWQTCGSGSDTNAQKEYVWPASATLPLEAADSIPPIGKDAGTNIDQLYVAFDSAADECRSVNFKVPSDVTSGTVTFRVNWYSAAATSGAAAWDFRHNGGVATGTDPDQSLTLEFIESDTTAGTAGMLNIASGTETIANLGWAANEQVDGVFCRDGNGTNGTDDLTGDALAVQFSVEIPRA